MGRDETSPALKVGEAVPLGHALMARVALDLGIRALAIKGPVTDRYGLRMHRQPVDIDIWVDPSRGDRFCRGLEALGWAARVHNTSAHVTPLHSVAYRHELWPLEVDVHQRFPGFLRDEQEVFDVLWHERAEIEQAQQAIPCTDLIATCAIAGLHLLRDPRRRQSEIQELCDTLSSRLDAADVLALSGLAARTGAQQTLAPLLDALGAVPAQEWPRSDSLVAWETRTQGAGMRSVAWAYAFSRTSIRRWPSLLKRALLLTEPEIRFQYPAEPPGWRGLLRGRIRRLTAGVLSAPGAVRLVWRHRRRNSL